MSLVHSLSIFASLLIQVEQVWNGSIIHVDGTSASTPTAASIFALVNNARIAKGKNRLGFLNPTLYSSKISSTFTDIIIGNAAGCGVVGFQATDGWDAATGLGTPGELRIRSLFRTRKLYKYHERLWCINNMPMLHPLDTLLC
jgi:hypothetical protein